MRNYNPVGSFLIQLFRKGIISFHFYAFWILFSIYSGGSKLVLWGRLSAKSWFPSHLDFNFLLFNYVAAGRQFCITHLVSFFRILRDRALYKVTCDFVDAAINGAIGVINRCIPPINPTDPECFHMWVCLEVFDFYDMVPYVGKFRVILVLYFSVQLDDCTSFLKIPLEGILVASFLWAVRMNFWPLPSYYYATLYQQIINSHVSCVFHQISNLTNFDCVLKPRENLIWYIWLVIIWNFLSVVTS